MQLISPPSLPPSHAAPSEAPESVQATTTTQTSIVVTWSRVTCIDRNAEITNYAIRDAIAGDMDFNGRSVPTFPRQYLVEGLIPGTNYTIGVAAQHVDLSASPPIFLAGVEGTVMASTLPVEGNNNILYLGHPEEMVARLH